MGGRGMSGESLSGGGGGSVTIERELDVWSYRHRRNNEPFVDAINSGIRSIQEEFPDVMDSVNEVNAITLGAADRTSVLGFYASGNKTLGINTNYTDIDKMNGTYDKAVSTGYHPSRGRKTGTEAVALHEMGHALTDYVAQRQGVSFDVGARNIVNAAYRKSGGRGGTKKWAGGISGYAKENYAECIAEAVTDYYCNGRRASSQRKAIMTELYSYR